MTAFRLIILYLLLDLVALDLISRRKNGVRYLWETYSDWKDLKYVFFKVFAVFYLLFLLPFTIPSSIYKLIKKNKYD